MQVHPVHGIERLARYIARGPLAKSRLDERPDGTLMLRLHREWSDGTKGIVFDPSELIEKLAALVAPPKSNSVFYTGVLGARAAWRAEVVPQPPEPAAPGTTGPDGEPLPPEHHPDTCPRLSRESDQLTGGKPHPRKGKGRGKGRSPWVPWAHLLWRVFGAVGWSCPNCHKRMRLRTIVALTPSAERIVQGLERARQKAERTANLPSGVPPPPPMAAGPAG